MSEKDQAASPSEAHLPAPTTADDDSDPGYEDLDEILDQFNPSSPPKAPTAPAPSASGPGRPTFTSTPSTQSEADFMSQLQAEFAKTMTNLGVAEGKEAKDEAQDVVAMGKQLEEFTARMEKEGLQPEDLLRAIIGEEGLDVSKINNAAPAVPINASSEAPKRSTVPAASAAQSKGNFEDTIRKTMERMQESDSSARDAAHTSSDNEQDILAQLMKAMESMDGEGNAGDDNDLSNLFLNMMHQLTSKELLYEPMKELDGKFPEWLEKNKDNLSAEDRDRYETQRTVVGEIVSKFEEKTYTDANEKDRAFVWEKMQKMQAAGSPPEDLIQAPFPGAFGAGTGGEGPDPTGGCPTQ